jgi:citrate synthase
MSSTAGKAKRVRDAGTNQTVTDAVRPAKKETVERCDFVAAESIEWPVQCKIGRGLQDAIACETQIGFVNGARGILSYRGYDIFDLCAQSSFEEVSFLIINGHLPSADELKMYKETLASLRPLPRTLRALGALPVERMTPMASLRVGIATLRQVVTDVDTQSLDPSHSIDTDADTVPDVTPGSSEDLEVDRAIPATATLGRKDAYRLVAGMATIVAAIARLRQRCLPVEPRPDLSHAANLLYMITGNVPDEQQARIMDIALIVHADHGMNASTFAAMVVASTLSDLYASVESGVGALSGPLHGGANEQVLYTLESIGSPDRVKDWFNEARANNKRIMGFGHRVYKTYDPRARVLKPLAEIVTQRDPELARLFATAQALEREVIEELGATKNIFPNVDFYSGLIYKALGIEPAMFTPVFAVSRVAGWVARCLEYVQDNRIFRPRAVYTGKTAQQYVPLERRTSNPKGA